MFPLTERDRYRAGVGISWPQLPLLVIGAFGAAALIAWLFKVAFIHGWYLVMIMPFIAAVALGGVVYGMVAVSHCRNKWLAGFVGFAAGLTAYLGYYQLCLDEMMPPPLKWRVSVLPRYIAMRMATDVTVEVGHSDPANKQPFVPLNWFAFVFELSVMVAFATAMGVNRAGRAYSGELGKWMRQDVAALPPRSGDALCQAIIDERLAEFVASLPVSGTYPVVGCRLLLEYLDGDYPVFDQPIYATLTDLPTSGFRLVPAGNKLLRQVVLAPSEVLALRPRFPELARLIAVQQKETPETPRDVLPALPTDRSVTDVATIAPVPDPYRQRVRGPGYKLYVNLYDVIPGVFFLGGGGLTFWGGWQATHGMPLMGAALITVGLPLFVWGAYSGTLCISVYSNRWIERRLRREIGQRPDPIVDPLDLESMYVSLIPRESFLEIRWTFASDLMLLKFDQRGRQLLMEGDSDRYRIPVDAIARCEPVGLPAPIDPTTQLWMVRLVVHVESGLREMLLCVANTRWLPMTNARRQQAAQELSRRIEVMMR